LEDIDRIVERAITYTLTMLRMAPRQIGAARTGLQRMRNNLARAAPDHPALERLQAFLDDLDLDARERSLH
jgi:hypothetical protein